MDILINAKLTASLSRAPAVRITTEIDSLKTSELQNTLQDAVSSFAWNRARLFLEYKNLVRQDTGWIQRQVMTTLKHWSPRAQTILAKGNWNE